MTKLLLTTITMKEFRESIGDDEDMLAFAADHLDVTDDAKVRITINNQLVTFELLET